MADVIPGDGVPTYKRRTEADPGADCGWQGRDFSSPGPSIVRCRVKAYISGVQAYVVYGIGFEDRWACDMPATLGALGYRPYLCHAPGTHVLVLFERPDAPWGVILGATPRIDTAEFDYGGDALTHVAGIGLGYDAVHRSPLRLDTDNPEGPEFSNGRPMDTVAGDYGFLNDLGVGLHGGKLQVQLRGGAAQLSVSALDNEIHMLAEAVTEETWTTHRRLYCDQGEGSEVRLSTPYLWEGLGAMNPEEPVCNYEDIPAHPSAVETQTQVECYAAKHWDQSGLFRYIELGGYLADGLQHNWVACPINPGGLGRLSGVDDQLWKGLAETQVGIDGFLTLRTAKGLLLEKTVMIPVPLERHQPHDPAGDADDECDWGAPEYREDEVDYQWPEDPTARQSLAADHNAHRTFRTNSLGLRGHSRDWRVTDERATAAATGAREDYFPKPLGEDFRADEPTSQTLRVDHRRPQVKYYASRAFVLFCDDGSIVFQDGYGSTISMSGGNVEISPRGSLVMRPAKDVVVMAPRDLVLNAGRNVEIAASHGDVLAKAERNMHLLSGNGGTGGTLIENRVEDPRGDKIDFASAGSESISSGILLKAKGAPLMTWSATAYLRSLMGELVLDSSAGDADVNLIGKNVVSHAVNSVRHLVGVSPERGDDISAAATLSLSAASCYVTCGDLQLRLSGGLTSIVSKSGGKPRLFLDGSLTASGAVTASATEIRKYEERSQSPSVAELKESANEIRNGISEALKVLRSRSYAVGRPGNAEFMRHVSFSFNASSRYGTLVKFRLNETLWQASFGQQGGEVWEQPDVLFQGRTKTLPWPGREAWDASESYGKMDLAALKNLDSQHGGRKSAETFEAVPPTPVSLRNNYRIDTHGT
ncbi:MAG: hypothetical protein WC992_00185 [Acholeplasmataceae bacterium]